MKFSILNPNKKIKPRVKPSAKFEDITTELSINQFLKVYTIEVDKIKPSENAIIETITPQVIKEEIVEEIKPIKKGKK
jgi:hypothetical protein